MENKIKEKIANIIKNHQNLSTNDNLLVSNKWYKGYDESFHKYTIYNGSEFVSQIKRSLKMGKRVCEDWASLLWSEKLDIAIKDKENLYNLLYRLKFWSKGNSSVELGFGLGYSAIVVDIKDLETVEDKEQKDAVKVKAGKDTRIELSVFNAFNISPLTVENDEITECAFITENSNSTNINIHFINENKTYSIGMYRKDKKTQKESYDIFDTESKTPLFAIIHPNIVNNTQLDETSQLYYPISILLNSIDTLKAVDNKYDAFDNEFVLGKKRVYVSAKLNKMVVEKDANGNDRATLKRTFDGSDVVIYQLPESPDEKPYIWSPTDPLRSADLIAGIKTELQILSAKVGLGNDYYNFEKGRVMTATQVISEKSDTFRNLKKHELILENSIKNLVKSIIYCNNTFTNNDKINISENEEIGVIFDDSIVEDKTTEKDNDRKDIDSGVLSRVEFRMKWYAEDEEVAKQKVIADDFASKGEKLISLLSENALTLKGYATLVYGDDIKYLGYSTIDEFVSELEERRSKENISYEDLLGGGNYIPQKAENKQKTSTESEKVNE